MNFFKTLLIFIFIFKSVLPNTNPDSLFINKFIKDYGFKARDRYTHEYNSAILEKTAYSLDGLEKELNNNKFNLSGRLIICGYEEQAFPSYYFRYKNAEINDEASSKSKAGWSIRLHNVFGFLTGFLFKDFNFYAKHWFIKNESIIEHINVDKVEILQEKKEVFQEHAFGPALEPMLKAQYKITQYFKEKKFNQIFGELINFWENIYLNETLVGDNKPASTQDILFSIEYAKHLIRSPLNFLKWYIGPDITYPIEISSAQTKEATSHAQNFVKTFSKKLTPINNKPTVFIFCSFVDGVGKSTLLGNLKNYLKYSDNIEEYERVDNSSSQLAEVFGLKENVFIADLPAQVSHFTYKPDGYVYVNAQREIDVQENQNLQLFILEHKEKLEEKYTNKLEFVKTSIKKNGFFAKEINSKEKPALVFLKNLILTKKESENRWIPFTFNDKNYLYNKFNPLEFRVLIPLKIVQSEGLKNIETEQMLFLKGIRLPLPYKFFMQDLVNKLKENNVENIVFVDFISMYPRSSRENIRINYLIQQLNLLDSNFEVENSLYKNFTNDSELLYLLTNKNSLKKITYNFNLEVLARLGLFNLINKRTQTDIKGIGLDKITQNLKSEIKKISDQNIELLEQKSIEKISIEKQKIEKIFGKTKNFINIQKLNFENIIYFSQILSNLFNEKITNEKLNLLWEYPNLINTSKKEKESGLANVKVNSINNETLHCHYIFNPEFKDEHTLTPFLRMLRSSWYASITNLFFSTPKSSETLDVKKIPYKIAPLFLTSGLDSNIYLIQRIFDEWENELPSTTNIVKEIFHLKSNEKTDWVKINEKPYRLNWNTNSTDYGLYAFDSNVSNLKARGKTACTFIVQKHQGKKGTDKIITTSKLYKKIKKSFVWKREYQKILKEAKKNNPENIKQTNGKRPEDNATQKNIGPRLGKPEQKPALQLIIRLLATMEMILKDPNADIALRYNNKKDFKAALKLFEKMTLPKYFGIIFEEKLFKDYSQVEPYPSWEAWEN